jgi:hypothetical protein
MLHLVLLGVQTLLYVCYSEQNTVFHRQVKFMRCSAMFPVLGDGQCAEIGNFK